MKIAISAKELRSATKAIKRMLDKSPQVGVEQTQNMLTMATATDSVVLETATAGLFVRVTLPAEVNETGRFVINRDMLFNLRLTSGDKIWLHHTPETFKLRVANGMISGELQVSEDYDVIEAQRPPKIPELDISLPAETLKTGVKRICFNTTCDRPLRMKMCVGDGKLTLSTNDSYRAAGMRVNLDSQAHGSGEIEIPAQFFGNALAPMDCEVIRLGMNESLIRIQGANYDVMHPVMSDDSGVIDVPTTVENFERTPPMLEALVEAPLLNEMLSNVVTFVPSSAAEAKVMLSCSEKNGGTLLCSSRDDTNVGKAGIPAKNVTINTRRAVMITARYILEMLTMLSPGNVVFRTWDTHIVLKNEDIGCCMVIPQLSHVEE